MRAPQPAHCFIECNQRLGTCIRGSAATPEGLFHFVPRNTLLIAPSLPALPLSRVIEQDVAHRARRNRHEVRLTAPPGFGRTCQAQVGLVHYGGRVERLITTPATTVLPGQMMQFAVDQRQQRVERLAITVCQLLEQAIDRDQVRRIAAAGRLWDHDMWPVPRTCLLI